MLLVGEPEIIECLQKMLQGHHFVLFVIFDDTSGADQLVLVTSLVNANLVQRLIFVARLARKIVDFTSHLRLFV